MKLDINLNHQYPSTYHVDNFENTIDIKMSENIHELFTLFPKTAAQELLKNGDMKPMSDGYWSWTMGDNKAASIGLDLSFNPTLTYNQLITKFDNLAIEKKIFVFQQSKQEKILKLDEVGIYLSTLLESIRSLIIEPKSTIIMLILDLIKIANETKQLTKDIYNFESLYKRYGHNGEIYESIFAFRLELRSQNTTTKVLNIFKKKKKRARINHILCDFKPIVRESIVQAGSSAITPSRGKINSKTSEPTIKENPQIKPIFPKE